MPRQYKVIKQGKEINLTNIEFRILYVLALHQGITLSKEKIYNYVWNGEYLQDDSNITFHVRRLRKKIEDNPSQPKYIQMVRGVGYKMNRIKKKRFNLGWSILCWIAQADLTVSKSGRTEYGQAFHLINRRKATF